jgi:pimeloyl-ACP methyl ester carboxylesterase
MLYHGPVKYLLGLTGAVVLAAAAAIGLIPFQSHVALRRLALWRGGAKLVLAGPLKAYELNGCRADKPCRCVALVHGLGDTAMTWDKTMLGEGGAPSPPEGNLLLAVNLPGVEGSPAAADYGIRAQARVLRAALEPRCSEWTVAGNSLGGWIAAWLAVDWPQGVKKLVLVNAAGLTDPSGLALEAARTLSAPTVAALKVFSARAYAKPRPVPERAWPAAVAAISARPTLAIFTALKLEDVLDARLKDVKADTTILWGTADGILPSGFAERFRKGVRGSRLVLIPGCGHLPQQECPASVSKALFGED